MEDKENAADIIRQILGFDPETGERVGGKIPISVGSPMDPPELQRAFVQEKGRVLGEKKVFPEKLLVVTKEESHRPMMIRRTYYGFLPAAKPVNQFHEVAVAEFQANFLGIRIWGERELNPAGADRKEAQFHLNPQWDKHSTFFEMMFGGRLLCLIFDTEGLLSGIEFGTGKGEGRIFLVRPNQINEFLTRRFLQVMHPIATQRNHSASDFELNIEDRMVKFERFEDGDIKDDLTFPMRIKAREIIGAIFHPSLLKDPFNAPPEADTWKSIDLMQLFGVKRNK